MQWLIIYRNATEDRGGGVVIIAHSVERAIKKFNKRFVGFTVIRIVEYKVAGSR